MGKGEADSKGADDHKQDASSVQADSNAGNPNQRNENPGEEESSSVESVVPYHNPN